MIEDKDLKPTDHPTGPVLDIVDASLLNTPVEEREARLPKPTPDEPAPEKEGDS